MMENEKVKPPPDPQAEEKRKAEEAKRKVAEQHARIRRESGGG